MLRVLSRVPVEEGPPLCQFTVFILLSPGLERERCPQGKLQPLDARSMRSTEPALDAAQMMRRESGPPCELDLAPSSFQTKHPNREPELPRFE